MFIRVCKNLPQELRNEWRITWLTNFLYIVKMSASSASKQEQRLKATMETHVALLRVAPVSMSAKDIDEAFEALEKLGYTVSYVICGECDEDDLLVELHTCHSEILDVLFEPDGLHPTTDLI